MSVKPASHPELLICSHRGPFVYESREGELSGRRGGGGLIGAIAPVLDQRGGAWIAAAMGDGDRTFARRHPHGKDEGAFRLRLLDLPAEPHHLHYDVVSNEFLWFLFHYLFDIPNQPIFGTAFARAWEGYRHVNELYADAIVGTRSDAVLIEDYHLMLAAAFVRKRSRARRPLLYFHHTPWCEPDYFSLLPQPVAEEVLQGMLAHDVVGFHAQRWADAFTACCERFLPKAKRRSTHVIVAPVPVDAERLRAELDDQRTRDWAAAHDEMRAGRKLLLRVDRIDLSKNPLRGFLAFEELLTRRPKLAREAVFLALLYPSRLNVESYRRYFADCLGVVRRINERFEKQVGSKEGPISLHFEDDFHRSLGAMSIYDALLVNPVFDGFNLVCKEGAIANQRDGSVILSRNAGAFEEFSSAVTAVNPFDVAATADAMEQAIDAGPEVRQRNARKLRRLATQSTPEWWIGERLAPVS